MTRDVFGIGVRFEADEPGVAAAVAPRLRRFREIPAAGADLLFRYVTTARPGAGARPAGPGRPVYDSPLGDVRFHPEDDALTIDLDGPLFALAVMETGVTTVEAAPGEPSLWLLSRPLLTLPLLEQMKRRGRFGMHAGAVARDGRSVLLAGGSGSGKSTLTLACVAHGLDFMTDDLVFLRARDGGIQAAGLREDADVLPRTVELVPSLADVATPPAHGFPKHAVVPESMLDTRVVSCARPVAIVLPEIAGGAQSRLIPVEPQAALLELVPDVLLTDRDAVKAHLAVLAALVARCPSYRLETGLDLREAAARVSALLD